MVPSFAMLLGCIFAFSGVAAGAFGAHALKSLLEPEMLAIFEVGVRYQLLHSFALLSAGLFAEIRGLSSAGSSAVSFAIGILIFSGSLYLLALTGVRTWGAATPIGGVAMLLGWVQFASLIYKTGVKRT